MAFDDFDATGRHRAPDLFDGDREDGGESFRDGLSVLFPRREDDVPRRTGRDSGHRPAHDLAVAVDLDLSDRHADGEVMEVVPLAADHERTAWQELPGLRLFRHLLR